MNKKVRVALMFVCFALKAQPAAELDSPTEMRSYIERYAVDRLSLMRAYPTELSSARLDRMKQLYAE